MFAPIGINKLYHPLGELVHAKIAGELGISVSNPSLGWSEPVNVSACMHL